MRGSVYNAVSRTIKLDEQYVQTIELRELTVNPLNNISAYDYTHTQEYRQIS